MCVVHAFYFDLVPHLVNEMIHAFSLILLDVFVEKI